MSCSIGLHGYDQNNYHDYFELSLNLSKCSWLEHLKAFSTPLPDFVFFYSTRVGGKKKLFFHIKQELLNDIF